MISAKGLHYLQGIWKQSLWIKRCPWLSEAAVTSGLTHLSRPPGRQGWSLEQFPWIKPEMCSPLPRLQSSWHVPRLWDADEELLQEHFSE